MEQPTFRPSMLWEFVRAHRNGSLFSGILVLVCFYAFAIAAPANFPVGSVYRLTAGDTASAVSADLASLQAVRSPFFLKSFLYIFTLGDMKVVEGYYSLHARQNVLIMAWRLSHGAFDVNPVKVTIPEGLSSADIAALYARTFDTFDAAGFLASVRNQKLEGYLFPDTYLFLPNATTLDIIKIMHDNFMQKTAPLTPRVKSSGHSFADIIKMASILEKEARVEDMPMVAGILWKRLAIGMPLQVDSSFAYINGKTTSTLTTADLKIDSPYNSYTHRGLPPTPISNPGLDSLNAALNPTSSPYLYFLSDKKGNMHYAKTNEEQSANKVKYLR